MHNTIYFVTIIGIDLSLTIVNITENTNAMRFGIRIIYNFQNRELY